MGYITTRRLGLVGEESNGRGRHCLFCTFTEFGHRVTLAFGVEGFPDFRIYTL
jgi:hypothetical protein